MSYTLLIWFALTAVFLPCCRIATSYARFRIEEARGQQHAFADANQAKLTLFFINVVGTSLLALIITIGPTLGSVDEDWMCHGVPYYLLLTVAAIGGAVGGIASYFWQQFLCYRISHRKAQTRQ